MTIARSSTANVQPALYSHKGTPVRYYIRLSVGSNILIEPLRTRAQGLILRGSVASKYLPSTAVKLDEIATVDGSGEVLERQSLPEGGSILSIEATVIYPSGITWEGPLEGDMNDVAMLVWGWDLAHRLVECDADDLFAFSKPWYEVPTTVLFYDDAKSIHCGYSHRCPKQCDAITKFL